MVRMIWVSGRGDVESPEVAFQTFEEMAAEYQNTPMGHAMLIDDLSVGFVRPLVVVVDMQMDAGGWHVIWSADEGARGCRWYGSRKACEQRMFDKVPPISEWVVARVEEVPE